MPRCTRCEKIFGLSFAGGRGLCPDCHKAALEGTAEPQFVEPDDSANANLSPPLRGGEPIDSWLKGLIAAACLVIIGAGGLYAYSQYQQSLERAESERQSMVRFCEGMIKDLAANRTEEYKGMHIATCVANGYVTEDDFYKAGAGGYVDQVRSLIDILSKK